jgi:hypothetical protein
MESLIAEMMRRAVAAWNEWGVFPEVAARIGVVSVIMEIFGQEMPTIVSGFRSIEKQRCLRVNWDAGRQVNFECSMPVARPATRSFHTGGLAVDVRVRDPGYAMFKRLWMMMPGAVWGGPTDPGHFHYKLPFYTPEAI